MKAKTAFEWPGSGEDAVVRAEHSDGSPLIERAPSGEWSLFRLLQVSDKDELSRTDFAVKWKLFDRNKVHGISASYTLRADSANNPFANNYFANFQCPRKLCD